MVPDDRMYTQEHEWVLIEDDAEGKVGLVGVTDFAAGELGDIVFVELPETGAEFNQGDAVGTIESVKAVADLYLPLSGEIIEVNQAVADHPELVNSDPFDEGWLLKVRIGNEEELEALLDARAYRNLLEG
ncbi:MAG: glycine cleavage system protein GcvH [Candidatus Krumholzibacteriia bacterium]